MKLALNEVSAVDVSSTITLQSAMADHSLEIKITGTVSALTVDLEGSLSGNFWAQLASHALTAAEIAALGAIFHVESRIVEMVRVRISAYTGTGTVSIWYTPYPNWL